MPDKIALPAQFLPCIDEPDKLLIMSDWLEDHGADQYLLRHLRWTAREWSWGRGLRREECIEGLEVFARYSNTGWSRAVIVKVTLRMIRVEFPHRPRSAASGNTKAGERAWWDLELRHSAVEILREQGLLRRRKYGEGYRPKPRKGYGATNNAALARALLGETVKRVMVKNSLQPSLFGEEAANA